MMIRQLLWTWYSVARDPSMPGLLNIIMPAPTHTNGFHKTIITSCEPPLYKARERCSIEQIAKNQGNLFCICDKFSCYFAALP